jgi:TonB-dependent starch-binding outer membrane protein SusC
MHRRNVMGRTTHRRGRLALAVLAALLCTAPPLFAQATGTIRGTVTQSGSGRPLAGARVEVVGSERGAVTNAGGEYTINGVPAGAASLRASLLGHAPATRAVSVGSGETASADFVLAEQSLGLDALVVTGTAGAAQRRTVGNAITQLDVEDLTSKTTVVNVTEILQSRTPGVTILPNAGTAGTAADIRIRGAGSLVTYAPVVYVDGVRYNTEGLGNFSPAGTGLTANNSFQTTSALNGINPNDIESIEVIKGPAASTLYGAEAAGGVIQIITKKGARGQQRTRWEARVETGRTEWGTETLTNYTTCDSAKQVAVDAQGSPVWPGCQGVARGTLLTDDPLRRDPDALRDGGLRRASVSVRGGAERFSFYVSGDLDEEEGVFLNNYSDRRSARANFSANPSRVLDFQVASTYINQNIRLPYGDESANGLLLSAARGRPGRVSVVGEGWSTTNPERSNQYNNTTNSDRLILSGTVNYTPFEWLRNRLSIGLDFSSNLAQLLSIPGDADVPTGLAAQRIPRQHVYTIDYAGNVVRDLSKALESTTSVGVQVNARQSETLFASGTGLGSPDVVLIGTAQTISGSNTYTENNSVGYFVQQQFGWNSRLFVTGALRADDHSAFGSDFDLVVYPKASFSWVLSEEPALAGIFGAAAVESFKLRGAWGAAGTAPLPYSATQTYTIERVTLPDGSTGSGLRVAALGNPELRSERSRELEGGFDASWFGGRLEAEFSAYGKRTTDAIVTLGIPGSSGFGPGGTTPAIQSRQVNIGEITNSGLELGISGSPVQSRRLSWETRLTLATNRNELVAFNDPSKVNEIPFQAYNSSGLASAVHQEHRPGRPLGGYYARFPRLDASGAPLLNATGTGVVL